MGASRVVAALALALCACVDGGGSQAAGELAPDAGRSMLGKDAGVLEDGAARPGEVAEPSPKDAGDRDLKPDARAVKDDDAGDLVDAGQDLGADAGCDRHEGEICAPSERTCGTCDGRSFTQRRSLVNCAGECVLGECAPHVDGWGDWNGTCYE